jgi:hypothetical protein
VGSPTRLWDRQCRRAKHLMRRPPWWHHGRDGDADVSSRWPTSGDLNMSEGDVTEDLPDDRHRRHEARPGQSASDREAQARAEDAARRAQIDADLAMNALELATREGDTHEMQVAIEWLQLAENNARMARHHATELVARQQAQQKARRSRNLRLILWVAALLLATVGALTILVVVT